MRWLELKVTTGRESSEAVAGKLMDLGAGGVSVEDSLDWATARREGLGDIFPETVDDEKSSVTIRGYLPPSFLGAQERDLEDFLHQLPAFGLAPAALAIREVSDTDWENAWKAYWHPTPVGEKLLILPAWQDAGDWPGRLVLRLDPGAAFGTGTHESTRLCLEFLEETIKGGETVLDLGSGSGILALAAKLLGAGQACGVDMDETAVRAARENGKRNQLDDVGFLWADLHREQSWAELQPADLICANLTADVLIAVRDRLPLALLPRGRVIASGIVRGRLDDVVGAYQKAGYNILEQKSAGEWVALLMELRP
ncbi:MAG: 50S ribosomal protein L11 methyltransferase [Bacillota bacterium]|nr:50S ribosomal protein L11 methyltransferase [Bacillota bacterium]MDW7683463.1 50S ribosomal protein L11 methyltransferase [Bacillota bacterium]